MEILKITLLSKGAAVANGLREAYRGGYLIDLLIIAAICVGIGAVIAGILYFIIYVGNNAPTSEKEEKFAKSFKICFGIAVAIVIIFYAILAW